MLWIRICFNADPDPGSQTNADRDPGQTLKDECYMKKIPIVGTVND
jgi:hypothetical protein